MPTARWGSAVVHIPGGGVLVIGGTAMTGDLPNVELLEIMSVGERDVHTWRQVDSMIKALRCPSAVYFDEAVYLVGTGESTVQMLSLPHNQPGQWTLIFTEKPPSQWTPCSMCVFNGRILVSTGTPFSIFPSIYSLWRAHLSTYWHD